ncbi:MAG: histidine phosphatase family protein [Rhizobacter sp.]|nr:histidine phosphatase family protein [Chlorobiales bacterium]
MPLTLLLVRHPETARAFAGRCIGQTDVPLSPDGERDCGRLATEIVQFAPQHLFSSDLERCRIVAENAAAQLSLNFEASAQWRELDFGTWERQSWNSIAASDAAHYESWSKDFVRLAPPEGESFAHLSERIAWQLQKIISLRCERVAIVTHAGAMRAAMALAIGLPPEQVFSIHLDYGATAILQFEYERWALVSLKNSAL